NVDGQQVFYGWFPLPGQGEGEGEGHPIIRTVPLRLSSPLQHLERGGGEDYRAPTAVPRNAFTTPGNTSSTLSTCESVVLDETLSRSPPTASGMLNPIASSTCDGSHVCEPHAAPALVAMPLRSSALTSLSPRTPRKLTLTL